MTESNRPEYVWAHPEPKPSRRKLWLIAGLAATAIAIAAIVLFALVLPGIGDDAEPTASPSASASPTPSATPSPSDTDSPTPSASPSPSATPTVTPPAPSDPDMDAFREEVGPRLDDQTRGLDLVTQNMDLGAQIVETLENDAAILSDTPAPSTIASEWSSAVSVYYGRLGDLRAAYRDGTDPTAALDAASAALADVRALIGL